MHEGACLCGCTREKNGGRRRKENVRCVLEPHTGFLSLSFSHPLTAFTLTPASTLTLTRTRIEVLRRQVVNYLTLIKRVRAYEYVVGSDVCACVRMYVCLCVRGKVPRSLLKVYADVYAMTIPPLTAFLLLRHTNLGYLQKRMEELGE